MTVEFNRGNKTSPPPAMKVATSTVSGEEIQWVTLVSQAGVAAIGSQSRSGSIPVALSNEDNAIQSELLEAIRALAFRIEELLSRTPTVDTAGRGRQTVVVESGSLTSVTATLTNQMSFIGSSNANVFMQGGVAGYAQANGSAVDQLLSQILVT